MIHGSCLCGAIEFEVEVIPGKIYNCHCSRCRKAHGAAFATQVFARGDTLRFIRGEDHLKEFKTDVGVRAFCGNCGSRLMNYALDRNLYLSVALANIDHDFSGKPVAHAFVGSKASWHEPSGTIPAYDTVPDGAFD